MHNINLLSYLLDIMYGRKRDLPGFRALPSKPRQKSGTSRQSDFTCHQTLIIALVENHKAIAESVT